MSDKTPAKKAAATTKKAAAKKAAATTVSPAEQAMADTAPEVKAPVAPRATPVWADGLEFATHGEFYVPTPSRQSPTAKLLSAYDARLEGGDVVEPVNGLYPYIKIAGYPNEKAANLARQRSARKNTDYDFALRANGGAFEVWARPNLTHAFHALAPTDG